MNATIIPSKEIANGHDVYFVKRTNDLTIFKDSGANRNFKPNPKLEHILATEGFDEYMPISVAADGTLLNGHHRIRHMKYITEAKGLPLEHSDFNVFYIIDNTIRNTNDLNAVLERIKDYNLYTMGWNAKNHYESYVNVGKEAYIMLNAAMNQNTILKGSKKNPREVQMLSLGHSVIVASHGFYSTSKYEFKQGLLPTLDIDFYNWVCNYIKTKNLLKAIGKTPFIHALTTWFTYYYPVLTEEERTQFDKRILNYAEKDEATAHIKNFCSFIDLRVNDKRVGEYKKRIICAYGKTKQIPLFSIQ